MFSPKGSRSTSSGFGCKNDVMIRPSSPWRTLSTAEIGVYVDIGVVGDASADVALEDDILSNKESGWGATAVET
jgi:hypothetical protein